MVEKAKTINSSIFYVEGYYNAMTKCLWECKVCSNNWAATSDSVTHGHGCPKCAARIIGEKNSKPVAQYKDGLEINRFRSVSEATKFMGLGKSTISRYAKGQRKPLDGSEWKYI